MACTACLCNNTISNTGTACTVVPKVARKLFFIPLVANDGTKNQILFTDTLNQTYLTAKINNPDPSKRWYPAPPFLNVEMVRPDPIFQTFDNQTKFKVQDTVKPFVGYIAPEVQGATSAQMISSLESITCANVGIFIIDIDNNLRGSLDGSGVALNPIGLNPGSFYAIQVDPTDKAVNQIKVGFDFLLSEKDSNVRLIPCADWNGADLLNASGLLDVCIFLADNITSTTVQLKLTTKYGDPINPIGLVGLKATDFVSSLTGSPARVYDATQGGDIVINTVTAQPAPNNNIYNLEFNTVPRGNVLNFLISKTGYDGTCMLSTPIVVPTS